MIYTRDNDGRVLTLVSTQPDGSTSKFSQTLAYQTAANPTTDTSLIQTLADTDTGTHAFGYDALNRLTSDATSGGTATWTYDAAGNRTQSKSASGTVTYYAYNPANELCETGTTQITTSYTGSCSAGSASGSNTRFTYDGNGNLLTGTLPGGATTQSYNAANQTTQSVTGGTTNGYAYNGTSQTQRKWGNGDAYDSGLDAKNGQPSRVNDGNSKYDWITRTPDGTPIALRSGSGSNSTNWYYTLDYQGSARRLSAANDYGPDGSYSYDDYGTTLTSTNYYPALTINPVNYTGGTTDASTGLTLHGARYANPATGLFTQLDPKGGGYAYTGADPVNAVDPTGCEECFLEDLTAEYYQKPDGTPIATKLTFTIHSQHDLVGYTALTTGFGSEGAESHLGGGFVDFGTNVTYTVLLPGFIEYGNLDFIGGVASPLHSNCREDFGFSVIEEGPDED